MGIRLLISHFGALIAVYSLVFGLPFFIALRYPQERFFPLIAMAFLATVGPFAYLFLQKKAADRFFRERRRYQAALIQASAGMGRVRDIGKLLKLISRIVIRVVRVEHSVVYILDKDGQEYRLGAAVSRRVRVSFPEAIPADSDLVRELIRTKRPVLFDKAEPGNPATDLRVSSAICKELAAFHGVLGVPSMIETRLVGFLVLGPKVSGKSFSADDLSMFTVVANQSATAIENALFYEDMKKSQEQLFNAEKMATIGVMADGLSHQINNRLHAMGFIAGGMKDTLALKRELFNSPELRDIEQEFEHSLSRLQDNVARGGAIVQGLMKYSRKGDEGYSACDIDKILDSACEMAQFKIKTEQMNIVRRYDPLRIPQVTGNYARLQEVFFNLIDNASDAMALRQASGGGSQYRPELAVSVEPFNDKVRIIFADNGIGVRDQDRPKLFTPFFTTKPTARKGTGLGLYVIRKIVEEDHGGRIEVDSAYMSGTRMSLTLSAAGNAG